MIEIEPETIKQLLPQGASKARVLAVTECFNEIDAGGFIDKTDLQEAVLDYIPVYKRLGTRMSFEQYMDAIRFVCLVQISSLSKAYERVFPDRVNEMRKIYTGDDFKERLSQRAKSYRNGKLVAALDAEMTMPNHIKYAYHRDSAMQKAVDMMNGQCTPSKMPVYEQDANGNYEKDEFGRKIQLHDEYGRPVWEAIHMVVTPKIQMDAITKVLDITDIPKAKQIDVNVTNTGFDGSVQKQALDKLTEIAEAQRQALIGGREIHDVQVIGDMLDDDGDE